MHAQEQEQAGAAAVAAQAGRLWPPSHLLCHAIQHAAALHGCDRPRAGARRQQGHGAAAAAEHQHVRPWWAGRGDDRAASSQGAKARKGTCPFGCFFFLLFRGAAAAAQQRQRSTPAQGPAPAAKPGVPVPQTGAAPALPPRTPARAARSPWRPCSAALSPASYAASLGASLNARSARFGYARSATLST